MHHTSLEMWIKLMQKQTAEISLQKLAPIELCIAYGLRCPAGYLYNIQLSGSLVDTYIRREIITVRGQSYVSRLPKY
jgi:hypothetical protein